MGGVLEIFKQVKISYLLSVKFMKKIVLLQQQTISRLYFLRDT